MAFCFYFCPIQGQYLSVYPQSPYSNNLSCACAEDEYENEYGPMQQQIGGVPHINNGQCNENESMMEYWNKANGNFYDTRCLYQCGRPLMPGYAGHVPGKKYHSAGRSFGNSTRDACFVICYRKLLCQRMPARVWEQ